MERSGRGPSHLSPYGQACLGCFKSKCKCVARPDGDGCQRCHRLNKQCHPSDSLRRRAGDKKHNPNARIAELEGRLNGLVSLLQSRNVLDDRGAVQQRQRDISTEPLVTTLISSFESAGNDAMDTSWTGSSPEPLASPPPTTALEPSADEAEACLHRFRSRMLRHFAFVHLPSHLTAQQLRRERPFLWRAIAAVTAPSARERRARGRELKRALCETAPSMDLLLGLLAYIAWGWDHLLNRGSLSRLTGLAMSMVGEMRLNKPAPQDAHVMGRFRSTPGFEEDSDGESVSFTTQLFLERQRAVLGCFLLSSAVSSYFAEVETLRWTAQMEEGLAAIGTNKECPTDAVFALQVRLQLIAHKAAKIRDQQQPDQTRAGPTTAAPAVLSLKYLQGQLQELRASLSPVLRQQEGLMAHTHYADFCINETIHTVHSVVPIVAAHLAIIAGGAPNPVAPSSATANEDSGGGRGATAGLEQLSSLGQCARATKACTNALLALPVADFPGIAFVQWAQLARGLAELHGLATMLETRGWDQAAARALVDLPNLLDRAVEKLERAADEAGERESDEVFTQLARTMRAFRADVEQETGDGERGKGDGAAWPPAQHYSGAVSVAIAAQSQAHSHLTTMQPAGFGSDAFWLDDYMSGLAGSEEGGIRPGARLGFS